MIVWCDYFIFTKNTEKKWAGFLPALLPLEARHVPAELPAQETLVALQQPFLQTPEKETWIMSMVQDRTSH